LQDEKVCVTWSGLVSHYLVEKFVAWTVVADAILGSKCMAPMRWGVNGNDNISCHAVMSLIQVRLVYYVVAVTLYITSDGET
jgi:hypothetical protein